MPKVLGCGVANIVPAKVEGQDHPGQHHDSKDWVLPKPPVFISQGHGGHREGEGKERDVGIVILQRQ